MKKTQVKDAVRNIKNRLVSYLSVCLVVMLGLTTMYTTNYMGTGLDKDVTEYYRDHKFKSFELISSLGLNDKSIEKIRGVDGVDAAEGVIQASGSVTVNNTKKKVSVVSLTKEVSVPSLTEGRLPSAKNECIVGEDFAEVEGVKVGDKVKITLTGLDMSSTDLVGDGTSFVPNVDTDGENAEAVSESKLDEKAKEEVSKNPLYEKEFVITGLMNHPDFFRRKATYAVTLPDSAYNKDVTRGLYTHAFVRIKEPENADMFKEEYFEETRPIQKKLEKVAKQIEKDRSKEVEDDANAYIDEEWKKAQDELDKAEGDIAAGETQLENKLAGGREKLNDSQNSLDAKVDEYTKKIKDGEIKIDKAEKKLEESVKEVEKVKKLLDIAKEKLDEIKEKDQLIKDIKYLSENYKNPKKKESKEYINKEKATADGIIEDSRTISLMVNYAGTKEAADLAKKLKENTKEGNKEGVDITPELKTISKIDVKALVKESEDVQAGAHYKDETVEQLSAISSFEQKLEEAVEIGERGVKDAEKRIEEVREYIKEKKKEIKEGKFSLKNEKAAAEEKIRNGWDRYFSEKAKYEADIAEAKELLAVNKEAAEKKLEDARAHIKNVVCNCVVLDRKANSGYTEINSNIGAIFSSGKVFGLLFMIVTAIVCLSTLIIIIDEEKKLVGTAKAFGFKKGEVLGKYLIFGLTASIVGAILAVIVSIFLSDFVQVKYAESRMYQIGPAESVVTLLPTLVSALVIIAVTAIASIVACSGILKSPAAILMKGAVLKKEKSPKKIEKEAKKEKESKKEGKSGKGSLYSKLILRNMKDDLARVLITIAIVAFSCILIGLGISMKLAFDGMMDKQLADINKYDMVMTLADDMETAEVQKLESTMQQDDIAFLSASRQSLLYRWNGRLDGLTLICADPNVLGDYFAVTDAKTGEDISIPKDGILIQKRMEESYGIEAGDKLTIVDSELVEHKAKVKGYFRNYVGRVAVIAPTAYKSVFGEEHVINSYYMKLNGADEEAVREKLLAVNDDISFETPGDFRSKFEGPKKLYNIIVIVTTAIAIIISFMILTNLANIYLARKKIELTVMRINGFSVKQTKGYLTREAIITTAVGLVLGVALGAIITPPVIAILQQPDLEFVKHFHVSAWAVAVVLEAAFAIIINTVVFNKVKKLNLRDIA